MKTQPTAPIAITFRVSGFALLALTAALTGACTASDGSSADPIGSESGSPGSAVESSHAPEDITDPEQAAVAAYLRYWEVVTAAFEDPDGDFTEFDAVAAEQALEYAQSIEQRGATEDVHGAGAMTHEVAVKDSRIDDEAQQVVVTDCADSTDTQVLDTDGRPVAGEEYGPSHVEALVELVDGRWLVTQIAVQEIGSCTPS
ncbi:hypothetical protein L0U85_03690 [Glycomyces sp. L485]|uniref:hypothetical protein n=1 Tax=Glycomyces sp. L485 TaxID=2909235 RepID=UPI001F4B9FFA|nr:hypothetical protein [Glycomyces sp. L485]MCH7229964.1 hypothetical protein [Glycomyces sp. L485]